MNFAVRIKQSGAYRMDAVKPQPAGRSIGTWSFHREIMGGADQPCNLPREQTALGLSFTPAMRTVS